MTDKCQHWGPERRRGCCLSHRLSSSVFETFTDWEDRRRLSLCRRTGDPVKLAFPNHGKSCVEIWLAVAAVSFSALGCACSSIHLLQRARRAQVCTKSEIQGGLPVKVTQRQRGDKMEIVTTCLLPLLDPASLAGYEDVYCRWPLARIICSLCVRAQTSVDLRAGQSQSHSYASPRTKITRQKSTVWILSYLYF